MGTIFPFWSLQNRSEHHIRSFIIGHDAVFFILGFFGSTVMLVRHRYREFISQDIFRGNCFVKR